ncbi:uncharacterized protein LOC128928119 isoform X1 [Callithrix jacchus]
MPGRAGAFAQRRATATEGPCLTKPLRRRFPWPRGGHCDAMPGWPLALVTRRLRMRMCIGVRGCPVAMSALPHRPAAAARENAVGVVRGGPWEGGCVPLAVQEPNRRDSTGSLNRLSFSGPLKREGASDLHSRWAFGTALPRRFRIRRPGQGSGPTGLEIQSETPSCHTRADKRKHVKDIRETIFRRKTSQRSLGKREQQQQQQQQEPNSRPYAVFA